MLVAWYLAFLTGRDDRGLQKSFVVVALGISLWLILRLSLPDALKASLLVLVVGAAAMAWTGGATTSRMAAKELLAGLLFALGCAAGVHVWAMNGHPALCAETLLLWALVTINMMIIHCSERQTKQHHEITNRSEPWWLQVSAQRTIIVICLVGTAIVACRSGNAGTRAVALAATISFGLTCWLHSKVRTFDAERFHFFADVVVVLPLPVVWWFV
jgi:hypothetical protein